MTIDADGQSRLADQVLDRLPDRAQACVRVDTITQGLTRFANSHVHQHVGDTSTYVRLRVLADGRPATVSSSRVTDEGIATLVDESLRIAAATPVDDDHPGVAEPHPVPDVDHVAPATVAATPDQRTEVVAAFVEAGRDTVAAGYCETEVLDSLAATTGGHRAVGSATRATLDGIHQVDGAAGSDHQTSRSLADLDGTTAGRRACELARAGRDPVELVPQRLPVVLGPDAVATMAVFLGLYGFNARAVDEHRSFVQLGQAQLDEAITLRDDVTDPRSCGLVFDDEGQARGALTLVERGTCTALAHDRRTAARAGTTSTGHHVPGSDAIGPIPTDLVLAPGDTSPGDLVGAVERGLLVTTLHYCRVLDPRTLVVTGLTRNGTFLVEDGRVTRPVGNVRFTQSFAEALAPGAVVGVGDDDRYASSEFGAGLVIAPSLSLASWNVTGGPDA